MSNCASCYYSTSDMQKQRVILICLVDDDKTTVCKTGDHDCPLYLYEPGADIEEPAGVEW